MWLWAKFSSSFLSRLPVPREVVLLRYQGQEVKDLTSHQLWEWIQTQTSWCVFTFFFLFPVCPFILISLLQSLIKGSFDLFWNLLCKILTHRMFFKTFILKFGVYRASVRPDLRHCMKHMCAYRLSWSLQTGISHTVFLVNWPNFIRICSLGQGNYILKYLIILNSSIWLYFLLSFMLM